MVDGVDWATLSAGSTSMIADLTYLGRLIDRLFEVQMSRAARRISARMQIFSHDAS
jgi:hypothetical protein